MAALFMHEIAPTRRLLSIALLFMAGCNSAGPPADAGGAAVGQCKAGMPIAATEPAMPPHAPAWRMAEATLHLGSEGPAPDAGAFRFSGLESSHVRLRLASVSRRRLILRGVCDGPVRVIVSDTAPGEGSALPQPRARAMAAGAPFALELAPRRQRDTWLEPAPATDRCKLMVSVGAGQRYKVAIEREERADKALRAIDSAAGACPPPPRSDDRLAALFHAPRHLSMTCALPAVPARLLADGREAFQARVAALTGAPLPEAAIEAGDITWPIDFSNAPQLDLILISALHMRADYSGYMLARMLAWHAERGTTVRLILTRSLQVGRNRHFYQALAARYPNIQLQLMRVPAAGSRRPSWHLDRLHRANHAKIFGTMAQQPGRSVFMLGGRNFHDGFAFESPRDLSRWPFLVQYRVDRAMSLDFFAVYRDVELAYSADAAVRPLMAHAAAYWHRDHQTQALRPGASVPAGERAGAGAGEASGGALMRHFLSVPFADEAALEDLYIEMFDAARERLDLASPFLNLPPRLQAALERAVARGVRVRILTRIEVPEPAAIAVTGYNRMFAEAHAGEMAIYAHERGDETLHSKVVIVDGRLSMVSSTNLNQRSFWHDTENGVLILDRGEAARLTRLLDGYQRDSVRLSGEQQVARVLRWLLPHGWVRRFF